MFFSKSELLSLAEKVSESYQAADPFPHCVVDDFLSKDVAENLLEDFPNPSQLKWWKYDNFLEKKLAVNESDELPEIFQHFLMELNSSHFIRFLEKLTGIPNIIPDPHHRGGGLHQIERGGKLHIHRDFNKHPDFKLRRKLNVLIYLNKDWQEEYGGHLELWDKEMTEAKVRVLPVFNRMVCFTLGETSWHGHPDPLNCPIDWTRKSIAAYYYVNDEGHLNDFTSTTYKKRPQDEFTPEEELLIAERAKGRLKNQTT